MGFQKKGNDINPNAYLCILEGPELSVQLNHSSRHLDVCKGSIQALFHAKQEPIGMYGSKPRVKTARDEFCTVIELRKSL